jgi:hypothetical protein
MENTEMTRKTKAESKSKKKRNAPARQTPTKKDESFQNCSICKTIPNLSWASWKGGDLVENILPPSMNELNHIPPEPPKPYFDDSFSHSRLLRCPECDTYYSWEFNREYIVTGYEEEIQLRRLSKPVGEKKAQEIYKAIESAKT